MKQDAYANILSHSCVAVLPQNTVQEIMETGAPTMPVHAEFASLHFEGGRQPEGLIRVAAWGQMAKRWPARSSLRVKFLNGDSRQREQAFLRMKAIDALCGLSFVMVKSGPSEIRVLFNPDAGHWSYLGTDCKSIPQNQQTMNIGLTSRDMLRSPTEIDRVVLHETLHGVAFNHEHQHPRGNIKWNREAVYAFYGETQGWSRAEIDAQVLTRSTATNIFGSAPDPTSIMMYPIPKELLLDPKQAVGWNTKLSQKDIDVLKSVYP